MRRRGAADDGGGRARRWTAPSRSARGSWSLGRTRRKRRIRWRIHSRPATHTAHDDGGDDQQRHEHRPRRHATEVRRAEARRAPSRRARPSHCTSRTFGRWRRATTRRTRARRPRRPGSTHRRPARRPVDAGADGDPSGSSPSTHVRVRRPRSSSTRPASPRSSSIRPLSRSCSRRRCRVSAAASAAARSRTSAASSNRSASRQAAMRSRSGSSSSSGSLVSPRTTREQSTAPYSSTETPPAHGHSDAPSWPGSTATLVSDVRAARTPCTAAAERRSRWHRRRGAPRGSTATGRGSGRRHLWAPARSRAEETPRP